MGRRRLAFKQADLAKALGISPSSVTIYKKEGMPVTSVDAALAWCEANGKPLKPEVVSNATKKKTAKKKAPSKKNSVRTSKDVPPPEDTPDDLEDLSDYDKDSIVHVLRRAKRAEIRAYNRMTQLEGKAGYDSALRAYNSVVKTRAEVERLHNELVQSADMIPATLAAQIIRQIVATIVSQLKGWPKSIAHRTNPKNPEIAKDELETAIKQLLVSIKQKVEPEIKQKLRAGMDQ